MIFPFPSEAKQLPHLHGLETIASNHSLALLTDYQFSTCPVSQIIATIYCYGTMWHRKRKLTPNREMDIQK